MLYGLEVFYSARMTASDLHALRRHGSAPARLAAELGDALAKPYKDEPRVNTGDYVSCLGDAGLVVALTEPDVLTTTVYPVSVSLHDPLTRGQTVVDRRYREEEPMFLPKGIDAPLLNVGTKLDGDRCVRAFVDVVTAK